MHELERTREQVFSILLFGSQSLPKTMVLKRSNACLNLAALDTEFVSPSSSVPLAPLAPNDSDEWFPFNSTGSASVQPSPSTAIESTDRQDTSLSNFELDDNIDGEKRQEFCRSNQMCSDVEPEPQHLVYLNNKHRPDASYPCDAAPVYSKCNPQGLNRCDTVYYDCKHDVPHEFDQISSTDLVTY